MKKIFFLPILLTCLIIFLFQHKENVNALVMYKSEVLNYNILKKYLKDELDINLKIDYIVDDKKEIDNYDIWEDTKEQLKNKLKDNKFDLLLDIPNEYLREFIEDKKLLKLDDKINIENIYPSIIDKSRKIGDGNMYFISPYFSNNFLLLNKNVFKNLELNIPSEIKSWNDILEISSKIKSKIEYHKYTDIYPLAFGMNGLESFFQDFEVLTRPLNLPIKSNNTIYDDKKWFDVFSFFMNLYKEYSIDKEVYTPQLFLNDKIAIKFVKGLEMDLYKDSMSNYEVYEIPSYKGFKNQIFLETLDISIPQNSLNKELALKILNHILSKEFAYKSLNENFFGEYNIYPFVSYIDNNILDEYKNKYNLKNSNIIYPNKDGFSNINDFSSINDYILFQEASREVIPNIILNKISIEDGLLEIKKRYLKFSNYK